MGKKNKTLIETDEQLFLYGSANGWLRISDGKGKELTLRPEFMKSEDMPTQFYSMGKFVKEEK